VFASLHPSDPWIMAGSRMGTLAGGPAASLCRTGPRSTAAAQLLKVDRGRPQRFLRAAPPPQSHACPPTILQDKLNPRVLECGNKVIERPIIGRALAELKICNRCLRHLRGGCELGPGQRRSVERRILHRAHALIDILRASYPAECSKDCSNHPDILVRKQNRGPHISDRRHRRRRLE
jgi:hypothetical protein